MKLDAFQGALNTIQISRILSLHWQETTTTKVRIPIDGVDVITIGTTQKYERNALHATNLSFEKFYFLLK